MKITLIRKPDQPTWLCRFEGDGSESVVRLFETNVLPTAFLAHADPLVVLREIKGLNDCEVRLGMLHERWGAHCIDPSCAKPPYETYHGVPINDCDDTTFMTEAEGLAHGDKTGHYVCTDCDEG